MFVIIFDNDFVVISEKVIEIIKKIMVTKRLLFFFFSICILACNNKKNIKIQPSEEISKSINTAKANSTPFEGKFIKIEKITERDHYLFLKGEGDSIVTFITMMPLNEYEISLLKKDVNNIKLTYKNYYNPVKKKTEKLVRYIQPIYDFK